MVKFRLFAFKMQILIFVAILFSGCANERRSTQPSGNADLMKYYDGKGIGPVFEVNLGQVLDEKMVEEGAKLFTSKCTSCHLITDERRIGPGLKGIVVRRRPEWIMNQILNPLEMTQKDSLSKELLLIYMSQMAPMGLSETEARSILEYLRTL